MSEKSSGASTRWIVRIVVLAVAAYAFHPLYMPMTATQPATIAPGDSITFRFNEVEDKNVYQELLLHGDGRNTIRILRPQGDADLPEGGGWKLKNDKELRIIHFSKEDLIDIAKGKRLFQQAVEAGVLDLKDLPHEPGNILEVSYSIGDTTGSVTGPAFVERAYHWNPSVWKNQQRWQDIILLLKDDVELRRLLSKIEITLVSDESINP